MPKGTFKYYAKAKINYRSCFLCGCKINENNESEEHVFPKWLQKRFELFSKNLTLLNRTSIKYSQLKIPCCKKCNNEHLSKLECKIQKAFDLGYRAFSKLNKFDVAIWVIKIFYGIIFKELFLLSDRSKKTGNTIINQEFIKNFNMLHLFMQTVRVKMEFVKTKPFSIKIFKLIKQDEIDLDFDYKDSLSASVWAVRMGDIGIILSHDHGLQSDFLEKIYPKISEKQLDVLQFLEIYSKFVYKSITLNIAIDYIVTESPKKLTVISSVKTRPEKWIQSDYARVLAFYTWPIISESFELALKEICPDEQRTITWLEALEKKKKK